MQETNLGVIADLAKQADAKIITTEDGREFALFHNEMTLKDVTPPGFVPAQADIIKQAVTLTAKDSFIEYVADFATPNTRIFADLPNARFLAVIDFHEAENPDAPSAPLAHRANLALKVSEEWSRWSGISGKLMAQALFVRFLEENMGDIEEPSGADILELAKDFSALRKVSFSQAYRSQTGDTSVDYAVEIEGRAKSGSINVPNKFVLRIPVYYGEPPIEQHAFLRYTIDDGQLKLGLELNRPEYVRQAVFEQIGGEIRDRLSRPVHYGAIA